MKTVMLGFCLLFASFSFAQTMPDFDLIKLQQTRDFKAAEPFAMQTAVYLLSTPSDKKNENRIKSIQFLFKWMSGTTDHSFILQDMADLVGRDNQEIFGLYMATMVRSSLDNKNTSKDPKQIRLAAVNMLLDYAAQKSNNLKMTKPLKKLAEARTKGELEQAL